MQQIDYMREEKKAIMMAMGIFEGGSVELDKATIRLIREEARKRNWEPKEESSHSYTCQ